MRKALIHILTLIAVAASLSSCRTAKYYNYQALAQASVKLGVDIDKRDNHQLYFAVSEWLGVRYRSGGNTKSGVDCSGFTKAIYNKVYKTELQRTTSGQMSQTYNVSKRKLHEGDLVFFSSSRSKKKVSHVGIYLKNKKFIHASSSRGVIVSSLNEQYYRKHWLRGGRVK